MDFLSSTYNSLRTPQAANQTPEDTIRRLADRLSPSTLLADRRASVLALKGLVRDWKGQVSEASLNGLLGVLENDAEIDSDIGKAVIETLNALCDVGEASPGADSKALGLKNTDEVLKTDVPIQKLFALLRDTNFYVRFQALQLLGTLLQNRRQPVQSYFLKLQSAPGAVLSVLEDKREIIKNEGLNILQSLITQSPDIQKLFAFEGAFEKLFSIIRDENGVDGGVVVQDCLLSVDGLLRLNSTNQTFFRETGFAAFLTSLLFFPSNLPPQEPAPQEFALQFWDAQKTANFGLVIGNLGILVGSKGSNPSEYNVFVRILVELALASNAPTVLKVQALRLLPTNITFPLTSHTLTPYVPVPETNDEEWDRLEPSVSLDILVEQILQGEYSGVELAKRKGKESLSLRTSGMSVFENYVRKDDVRQAFLRAMIPEQESTLRSPVTLLQCLTLPPPSPLDSSYILCTQLATLVFSSLLRSSFRAKEMARTITPPSAVSADLNVANTNSFFIPANGLPPPPPSKPLAPEPTPADDDEPPQSLLAVLAEHLSLCFLSRAHAATSETAREMREWDRLIIAFLALLSQWLWEDPKAVREFLENGGMGMLVEPINQTHDVDPLVQGLCAFLLGVCYEFNREPGEITRTTIHAIFNRLSVDALIGRMSRVREDERFKTIGPEDIIMPYRFPSFAHVAPSSGPQSSDAAHEAVEIWFDWAFVDFWKSNYYTIQRAVSLDPDTLSSSSSENAEAAMLIASLRSEVRDQAARIEELQSKVQEGQDAVVKDNNSLREQIASLTAEFQALQQKNSESEKEQEDLLIFLEELSTKRRRDKERLRALGQEVSEDEGDADGNEDDDADADE